MKIITFIVIISITLNIVFCGPFDAKDETDLNQQKRNVNEKLHPFFNWDRTARINWLDSYLSELGRLKKRDADFNEPISTTPKDEAFSRENELLKSFGQSPTTEGDYLEKPEDNEKFQEKEEYSDCSDSDEEYEISYEDSDECDDDSSSDITFEIDSDSMSDDWTAMNEGNKKRKRSNNLIVPKYKTKYIKHHHDKYRKDKTNEKMKRFNPKPEIRNYKKNSKKHPKNLSYETVEIYRLSDDESDTYEHDSSCYTKENNGRKIKYQPERHSKSNRKNHYIPIRRFRRDLTAVSKNKQKKFDPKEMKKKSLNQSEMKFKRRAKHIY